MTRFSMYVKLYQRYGKNHKITKQFAALMKNPDVKNRHLEKSFQYYEKN